MSSLTAQANVISTHVKASDLCGGPYMSTQCQEGNPLMPSQLAQLN